MKVIVNNQLLEYEDRGNGRVVLMLHGWGVDLHTFDRLVDYLSQKYRVIRFDFPGFGKSPKPTLDWLVDDYARLVRDLLQKLNITDLYAVIAHSFGGRVTIKGISQDYFKPNQVILIGTAGVKPTQSVKKTIYKTIAKIGKIATALPLLNKLQPKLRQKLYSMVGSTDYLQADQMKKIFLNTINEDLLPEVKNIKQPTLLIWGENDTETPLNDAKLILNNLRHGQLRVIKNSGHFVYIEAFDKVIKEIDGFLL
jgi:pimeloyl-ACP methyl ester carboxylesterase